MHAGLAIEDAAGVSRPQLAEAVPSLENGLWELFPDGRMETTWRIRANARWHDGTAFTSADLVFTHWVVSDREIPEFRDVALDSVEALEAPDPRTVTVRWKRPFIAADSLFTFALATPMPKHLLEGAYLQDKTSFTQQPAWSEDFIGAGPFKLRQWVRGSNLLLEANIDYVLGRPKLDQIEVRFLQDISAFFANMLARTVDLNLGGRNLSLEQGLQLRDQWDGRMEVKRSSRFVAYPQFLNPDPPVVGDVRFRRALIHAVDRQLLADVLLPGSESPVAHVFLNPSEREFREIQATLVRYDFNPGRSTQLIKELGYVQDADGAFRDPAGQRLSVEIRSGSDADLNQKIHLALADSWQRVGVAVDPVVVPPQRQRDLQYRATFPAFDMVRQPSSILTLNNLYSSEARLSETNFLGRNYARYMNPALDGLIDRYFNTVPWQVRMEVGRQIMRHITDQVIWLDLFYDAQPIMISRLLKNVHAAKAEGSLETWNAHEWDVE
jgi:peptide/nickel transport system substrate-binding protein